MTNLDRDIEQLYEYLQAQYAGTTRELTLSQTIKLSEEVGELCEVVLQETGGQMRSKAHKQLDLPGEIADVIICTLLVAKCFNAPVWEAVNEKIKQLLARIPTD